MDNGFEYCAFWPHNGSYRPSPRTDMFLGTSRSQSSPPSLLVALRDLWLSSFSKMSDSEWPINGVRNTDHSLSNGRERQSALQVLDCYHYSHLWGLFYQSTLKRCSQTWNITTYYLLIIYTYGKHHLREDTVKIFISIKLCVWFWIDSAAAFTGQWISLKM